MKDKMGLAISGGGYRATLFALGTLWRFNEDGLLTKLDTITSVSGGAIVTAYLQYKWSHLTFECLNAEENKYRATNFKTEIVNPLLEFCKHGIDISSILVGTVSPFSTPAKEVEKKYDKYLFHGQKLSAIAPSTNAPEFVYYATNYDTGVSVRITKDYLSDYVLGWATGHDLSIAKAVSISSAFPPFMAPVTLSGENWNWDKTFIYNKTEQINPELLQELRKNLHLCDGGLYDNLALEMLWKVGDYKNYSTVFSCNAGSPFDVSNTGKKNIKNKPKGLMKYINLDNNWITQLTRMIAIMISQQVALRKRGLVENYKRNEYKGAYWAINTSTRHYQDIPHIITEEDEKKYLHLSTLPTQLRPFEGNDNMKLINWGFSQAYLAIKGRFDANLECRPVPFKI